MSLRVILQILVFDGVWSNTTKLIILALKARKLPLELNLNWVITSQCFVCPVCQRTKVDIMYKAKDRVSADLHIDHDHLLDLMKLKLQKLCFPDGYQKLVEKYLRYKALVMCASCNKIDSQIKIILPEVDKFFLLLLLKKGFALKKLERKLHLIDYKCAKDIWLEKEFSFKEKKNLLDLDIHDLNESKKGKWFDYRKKSI